MNYQVGDIIEYKTFDGSVRLTLVLEKEADIKNGRPGFVGDLVAEIRPGIVAKAESSFTAFSGARVWGYDNQVVAVRKDLKVG